MLSSFVASVHKLYFDDVFGYISFMKVIGLTGGIGSGKSLVASIFASLGIPVYIADQRAKDLYIEDHELKTSVIERFGSESYHQDGTLNRAHLAEAVFKDSKALADLNALVHPRVRLDFQQWKEQQQSPYVIREAAILFESGTDKDCFETITISSPEEIRIERVMKRDQSSREHVKERMSQQWTDEQRIAKATHEIKNDGKTLLLPEIMKLHERWVNT